jgi:hypothetical protein
MSGATSTGGAQPQPAPRSRHGFGRSRYPFLGGAAALLLVGGLLAIVIAGKGHGPVLTQSNFPVTEPATSTEPAATSTEPATTSTEPATTSAPAASPLSRQEAEAVLTEYESDYSSENLEALKGLFGPNLVRTDGSGPAEDLEGALATYQRQFSEQSSPTYTLTGVHIETAGSEATAKATYSVTNQYGTSGGSITFHLVTQSGGHPLIDRITISR